MIRLYYILFINIFDSLFSVQNVSPYTNAIDGVDAMQCNALQFRSSKKKPCINRRGINPHDYTTYTCNMNILISKKFRN